MGVYMEEVGGVSLQCKNCKIRKLGKVFAQLSLSCMRTALQPVWMVLLGEGWVGVPVRACVPLFQFTRMLGPLWQPFQTAIEKPPPWETEEATEDETSSGGPGSWRLGQRDATFLLTWHTVFRCGKQGSSHEEPGWVVRRLARPDTALRLWAWRRFFSREEKEGAFYLLMIFRRHLPWPDAEGKNHLCVCVCVRVRACVLGLILFK